MSLKKYILKEFESGQLYTDIELTDSEYELVKRVFTKFGADIDDVIETTSLNESDSILNKAIGSQQRINQSDKTGRIIKVNPKVIASIENFASEGSELQDWYHDMSRQIHEALGESDACLYLMLVASCSPQNQLTKNLIEASQLFIWFKTDLNENSDMVSSFLSDVTNSVQHIYELLRTKYKKLNIAKAVYGGDSIPVIDAKLKNIINTFKLYVQSSYAVSKGDALQYITLLYNPNARTANNIIGIDNPIRGLKVMNFALNLIDPDYSVSDKWYNVTIDSWMIQFFYPNIIDKEKDKVFKQPIRYMYLAKIVGDTAKKIGTSPTKLQASIWVAKLKSEGRSVDSFQKVLQNKMNEFKANNDQLDNVEFTLKDVILFMSSANYNRTMEPDEYHVDDETVAPF